MTKEMPMIQNYSFWKEDEDPDYFHPAISRWNDRLIMTMQTISGNDHYGPVMWSQSTDEGKSWSSPQAINSLRQIELGDGLIEGVADVRPEFHVRTGTVIALGCNLYYNSKGNIAYDSALKNKSLPQFPVYAVLKPNGIWSERKRLEHAFFSDCAVWRTACAQISVLKNGDLLLPVYFKQAADTTSYSVCTVLCSFDGNEIKIKHVSNVLSSNIERGLLEPSVVHFNEKYFMTIRSEDNSGYFSCSSDGLNWPPAKSWRWENGEPLLMSTTQQHWLTLGGRLYLVYTRKSELNSNIFRWRAPLFMAEFDQDQGCLIKDTEKTVFPIAWKENIPNLLGNFHVSNISSQVSFISDGSLWVTRHPDFHDRIVGLCTETWIAKITIMVSKK